MIGFGSIGKGTLPLIERHFDYDKERFVVIDPDSSDRKLLDERGIEVPFNSQSLEITTAKRSANTSQPAGVRASASIFRLDTPSLDIMRFCREIGALYIDTVIEPWPGFYFDKSLGPEARTNYALRETVLAERRKSPGGTTAVSCRGANPGMVSWFVKQALVNLAADLGDKAPAPETREEWGRLAERLGVKGAHIAERDTQRAQKPQAAQRLRQHLVDRRISFRRHAAGRTRAGVCTRNGRPLTPAITRAAAARRSILNQPGADTRVRSWTPTAQAQFGFLVTHNEVISIADYYTLRERKGEAVYRPTCHYAYHPCDDAVLSACMNCSAARARCRRSTVFFARRTFSMGSTNSACCSTAISATLIGTARS